MTNGLKEAFRRFLAELGREISKGFKDQLESVQRELDEAYKRVEELNVEDIKEEIDNKLSNLEEDITSAFSHMEDLGVEFDTLRDEGINIEEILNNLLKPEEEKPKTEHSDKGDIL
jgi:chromosome segregation ATPase